MDGTYNFIHLTLICLLGASCLAAAKIEDKCKACKEITDNFKKGLEKTAKNHFGGGDTAWEESRLGSYARSETRLLEILEDVCEGAKKESSCHALVEEQEEEIETFWFAKERNINDFERYLCVEKAKVCCPQGKWGKTCKPCPGGSDNPCSGNGICSGSGTSGGTGECECEDAYDGEVCNQCNDGYYRAGNKTCLKCHESCDSSCTNGTDEDCNSCATGYTADENGKCVDKNECEEADICEVGKFCFNTKGSYRCHHCDPACKDGCTNTGRLSCNKCNEGWETLTEGGCKDINECEQTDSCMMGTYCKNTEGSFSCEQCHSSCAGGCTGDGSTNCLECAQGYEKTDDGCVDVNECETKKLACASGQVCVNTDGPDKCHECHQSCMECVTTDEDGCLSCHYGFKLENNKCKDINECEGSKNPCDKKTEKCSNTLGSYKCKCKTGYVRTKKGVCKKKGKSKKARSNRLFKTVAKYTPQVVKNIMPKIFYKVVDEVNQGKFTHDTMLVVMGTFYSAFFLCIFVFFKLKRYYWLAGSVVVYSIFVVYSHKFMDLDTMVLEGAKFKQG